MNLNWPVQVYPHHDELLSSWLVRASLAHGCDPLSLTSTIWPTWRAWTVDLDRHLDETRLLALNHSSGLSTETLTGMTLFPHIDGKVCLVGKTPSRIPWLIAMGSRNRRHKMGVPYCPVCLQTDMPYFRWQWRLSWYAYCPEHQCKLIEHCPSCHTPVQYHRINAQTPHIGVCSHCGHDLRVATPEHVDVNPDDFQCQATRIFDAGATHWGDSRISSLDWFLLTRLLLNLIRRAAVRQPLGSSHLGDVVKATGIDLAVLPLPPTRLPLELLPISQRTPLLAAVAQMLSVGRDPLIYLLKEHDVSRNTLIDGQEWPSDTVMAWLNELPANSIRRIRTRPSQPKHPKTKEVVLREWALLLRRHGLTP